MYVAVTLDLSGWHWFGDKTNFWKSFEAHRLGRKSSDEFDGFDQTLPDRYEQQFRRSFAGALQRLVNEEIETAWRGRSEERSSQVPKISVRLLTVEYGSIKAVMDIMGVENSDLREFVLTALEIYSPVAFTQVMNADVTLHASVDAIGREPPVRAVGTSTVGGRVSDTLGRAWIISNATLLVPVLLSLAVLYYAMADLHQEGERVVKQGESLKLEREKLVTELFDANKTLSQAISNHANNNKALQEFLIAFLKIKSADIPASTPATLSKP